MAVLPSHSDLLTARHAQQPCQVHGTHRPAPLRTVQHHIWPREYGGPPEASNRVWTCDTGHYNIHVALALALDGQPVQGTREERRLALLGVARMREAAREQLRQELAVLGVVAVTALEVDVEVSE